MAGGCRNRIRHDWTRLGYFCRISVSVDRRQVSFWSARYTTMTISCLCPRLRPLTSESSVVSTYCCCFRQTVGTPMVRNPANQKCEKVSAWFSIRLTIRNSNVWNTEAFQNIWHMIGTLYTLPLILTRKI